MWFFAWVAQTSLGVVVQRPESLGVFSGRGELGNIVESHPSRCYKLVSVCRFCFWLENIWYDFRNTWQSTHFTNGNEWFSWECSVHWFRGKPTADHVSIELQSLLRSPSGESKTLLTLLQFLGWSRKKYTYPMYLSKHWDAIHERNTGEWEWRKTYLLKSPMIG